MHETTIRIQVKRMLLREVLDMDLDTLNPDFGDDDGAAPNADVADLGDNDEIVFEQEISDDDDAASDEGGLSDNDDAPGSPKAAEKQPAEDVDG